MKRKTLILILIASLFLITSAGSAMSSSHYQLNWYPPLTGSGGVTASAHYTIHFAVGQTAGGASTGPNYKIGLGYWPGVASAFTFYVPMIKKSP
jgi:hypothetical protein